MMKIIKKIILILIAVMIGSNPVLAYSTGYSGHSYKPSGGGGGGSGTKPPKTTELTDIVYTDRKYTYNCEYVPRSGNYSTIRIEVYDDKYKDDTESLIPSSKQFPTDYGALAGTAVGIHITDVGNVYWRVYDSDIKVTYKKYKKVTKYKCKYETDTSQCNVGTNNFCEKIWTEPTSASNKLNNYASTLKNVNTKINLIQTEVDNLIKCKEPTRVVDDIANCKQNISTDCLYLGDDQVETFTEWVYVGTGTSTNTTKLDECRKHAITAAITGHDSNGVTVSDFTPANTKIKYTSAYRLDLTNSNDINGTNMTIQASEANKGQTSWKCVNPATGIELNWGSNGEGCKFENIMPNYIDKMLDLLKQNGAVEDMLKSQRIYKKDKTCINVKTGEVSYVPTYDSAGQNIKTDCDSNTEYTINNDIVGGLEHWHYFIPLNAKSNSDVEMNFMMNWQGKLDEDECKSYLDTYPYDPSDPTKLSYVDLVVRYDKSTGLTHNFDGTYYDVHASSTDPAFKNTSSDWYILDQMSDSDDTPSVEATACRVSQKHNIPIKQGFYNEVIEIDPTTNVEKVRFNGFNFYYKPIDASSLTITDDQTSRIFPNGITTDALGIITTPTLWDEWYNAQKNPTIYTKSIGPNLTESYTNATYYAQYVNVNKIREYTKLNPYTSWSNMNIDGTSNFIGVTEGVVTRYATTTTNTYELGCGPLNEYEFLKDTYGNDLLDANGNKIQNIYYQPECGGTP